MYLYGEDRCDHCHVKSARIPFPHMDGCRWGTGDPARDMQIRIEAMRLDQDAMEAERPWLRYGYATVAARLTETVLPSELRGTGIRLVIGPDPAVQRAAREDDYLCFAGALGVTRDEARRVLAEEGTFEAARRRLCIVDPLPAVDLMRWIWGDAGPGKCRRARRAPTPPSRVLNARYRQRMRNRVKRKNR